MPGVEAVYDVHVIFEVQGERVRMSFVSFDPFPIRSVLSIIGKTKDEVESIYADPIGNTAMRTFCTGWQRL